LIITDDYKGLLRAISEIKADNSSMADRLASLQGEVGAIKEIQTQVSNAVHYRKPFPEQT